jgi:hypothetical protein
MRFFTVILATVASLSITAAQTGAQTAAQTADGVGKAMAVIDSASASAARAWSSARIRRW